MPRIPSTFILVLTLISLSFLPFLHAQELVRGSRSLKVEEMRPESVFRLTLSDVTGRVLYRINRELAYDTPRPAVHLYANGSVLLVDSFAGVYERYSTGGEMVSRVPFNTEIRPNHERTALVSGNDSTAAVLISEPGEPDSRILLFDQSGSTRLDRPFEGSFASGLLLSPDGRLIAGGTYSWRGSSLAFRSELMRTDGSSLSSLDHELKGGSWAPDGKFLVIYGTKTASLFDVEKRDIVSTMDLGQDKIVHEVLWDGSIPLIASSPAPTLESGKWIYPQLTVLNLAEGKAVYRSAGPAFRSLKMEKTPRGVFATIDGLAIQIK